MLTWHTFSSGYPTPNVVPMQPVIMQVSQPVFVKAAPTPLRPAPVYAFPKYTPKFYDTIEP